MDKIDLKKTLSAYWKAPAGKFVVIDVPRLNFLWSTGKVTQTRRSNTKPL